MDLSNQHPLSPSQYQPPLTCSATLLSGWDRGEASWGDWERHLLSEAWYTRELLVDERRIRVPEEERTSHAEYFDRRKLNKALRRHGYRGRAALRLRFAENLRCVTTRPGRSRMMSFDGLHKASCTCCITEVKYAKRLPGSSAFMHQGCMGDVEYRSAACLECLPESGEREGKRENGVPTDGEVPASKKRKQNAKETTVSGRRVPRQKAAEAEAESSGDEEHLREPPLDPTLASALLRRQRLERRSRRLELQASRSRDAGPAATGTLAARPAPATAPAPSAPDPSASIVYGDGHALRRRGSRFSYAEKALARINAVPAVLNKDGTTSARAACKASSAATTSAVTATAAALAAADSKATGTGKQKRKQRTEEEQLIQGYGKGVLNLLERSPKRLKEGTAGAAPIGKNLYTVDRISLDNSKGLERVFRVAWVGWKSPEGDTFVPESEIFPDLVALHDRCVNDGRPFPSYLDRMQNKSAGPVYDPNLHPLVPGSEPVVGDDLFRIPEADMLALLAEPCRANLKAQQAGEPKGGYRAHVGGILAANSSDNLCLDWDWFRNSESISSSLYFVAALFNQCPKLLDEIEAIAQDDACHFKKSLQAALRRLIALRGEDQPDTPAMALYRKILSKAIIVDRFHYKNHNKETDTYCMTNTNPDLDYLPVGLDGEEEVELQPLIKDENSESSEQLFRWMGRLGHILNQMPMSRATFFTHRMVWLHNERTILRTCMTEMKQAEVRRVRAAYGLPHIQHITSKERMQLAKLLLNGTREYDLEGPEYKVYLSRSRQEGDVGEEEEEEAEMEAAEE